jgi:tetratricopeptide (TPR) repeat protein
VRNQALTLEKLGSSNKWFIFSVVGIILIIILTTVSMIHRESTHKQVKQLYTKAFIHYSQIDFSKPYTPDKQELIQTIINDLNKVVATKKTFNENYFALDNLAHLYYYIDDKNNAIKNLELLKKAPSSFLVKSQGLITLSRLYIEKNKFSAALSIYETLIESKDFNVKNLALFDEALLFTKMNRIHKALSTYKKISVDSSLYTLAQNNIIVLESLSSK